ncbi:hypothetical protein MD484_g3247, partial [Candolleomyces efflorescens]
MATTTRRTRSRAATNDAGLATQPDALGPTSGPAAIAAGDALDGENPTRNPRTYATVAASPPSSPPSSPLFTPRTTNEPSLRDESHVPEDRVSGSNHRGRDNDGPRPQIQEAAQPNQLARSSMMSRTTTQDPRGWTVVSSPRRTRSLESVRLDERVVQFDTRNRYAGLPPVNLTYRSDVRDHEDVLAQAERMLTPDQRDVVHRRMHNINRVDSREPSETPVPPKRPFDKGKGPDARNWGNVHLEDDENEPEVQRAVYDSYRNMKTFNNVLTTVEFQVFNPLTGVVVVIQIDMLMLLRRSFKLVPTTMPVATMVEVLTVTLMIQETMTRMVTMIRIVPLIVDAETLDEEEEEYLLTDELGIDNITSYDGSPDLDKYTEWRDDCRRMVKLAKVHPRDQVELIAPYLEKRARKFYLSKVAPNPRAWTFSQFMDELFNGMFPKDFKSRLRQKLNDNTQGSRSVWDYVQDLNTKLDTVGIHDDLERVYKLWNGFNDAIQGQLWEDHLNPEYSTWDEIVRSAEDMENALRVRNRITGGARPNNQSTQGRHDGSSTQHDRNVRQARQPIQASRSGSSQLNTPSSRPLNHGSSTQSATQPAGGQRTQFVPQPRNNSSNSDGPRQPPSGRTMTDAERQEHISTGKCFRCHGFGHIARACPRANLVRSNNANRPPGMASFNLEMGYDENDIEALNETDPTVEESLPQLMSNSLMFDIGHKDSFVPEDYSHKFCHFGRRQKLDEFDHRHYPVPDTQCFAETVRHEPHEPSWMVHHDCPSAQPRLQLGDCLSMMAEYVLNSSQPYPGDNFIVCRDNGIRGRFGVHELNKSTYGIYDRLLKKSLTVPKFRLEHPNFRLGRFYALHRNRELKRTILEGEYSNRMGDAYSIVASFMLRDGIRTHYPSQKDETDPEDRFDVQIWDRESDTFVINDYDKGTYILISGLLLKNPKFDLVRWYQVASQGLRGYSQDTHLLPGTIPDEDINLGVDSEAPGQQPLAESVNNGDFDDLPALQSISCSDSSDTSSDDLPYPAELDFSDSDEPYESNDPETGDALSGVIVDALLRGNSYPGDPMSRNWVGIRFEALRIDSESYQIFDHLRSEVVSIPVELLRNPSFNIGLWYAEVCASRTEGLDLERAIVRWLDGRDVHSTLLGRGFERRLEFSLNLSAANLENDEVDDLARFDRFLVLRDPRSSEYLLVTDRAHATVRTLRSADAEDPNFDINRWYEQEGAFERYRHILLDETEFFEPPRLFGDAETQAYAQTASNHRAWDRVLPMIPRMRKSLAKLAQDRREIHELMNELRGDLIVSGIQVPSSSFPALQRNASALKTKAILVPKPLVVVADVNGHPTRALLDSGSLGDFVSATLVDQLKVKPQHLDRPLDLQLAVQGSRSKVNSTVKLQVKYQSIDEERTFYVVNISNYDLILGTPFMYQHQVCIGLNPARVVIGSSESKEIPPGTDTKPVLSGLDFDSPQIANARKHLEELAEPLCKDVEETGLPPLRAINHTIPLIDESAVYHWRPSRCPDMFREQWAQKRDTYLRSGRWEMTTAGNTVPMLLIPKPKKDKPELRTVFDLRERNRNTRKMTSPLPDIEGILRRVTRKPYRSALDLKSAYEQIRIVPEHVSRTAVTTPDGNIVSHVIQQGDCNAPATYQALMNHIFSPYLGVFMDVYLDDIIIYSDTLEDHIEHVRKILEVLKRESLYLSKGKLRFIAHELEILGHIIDDEGIQMDPHKVDSVLKWKTPTNRDLLRGFLGSVGYLADDIPGVRVPMGVLSAITGDTVPFRWTYTEQRAFEEVKQLVHDSREHHRVPLSYEKNAPPIWLVTDGCATGISGVVCQGTSWKNAKVAAFYSAKLNPAQRNYPTHEIEMLAGVETMLRFRDILQGAKFTWVTDHKGLTHLLNQRELSGRQARWMEKIGTFDFTVEYVPGVDNVLADALSRIYANDSSGTVCARSEYTYHDVINDDVIPVTDPPMPVFAGIEALAVSPQAPVRRSSRLKALDEAKLAQPKPAGKPPRQAKSRPKRPVLDDRQERGEGGSGDSQIISPRVQTNQYAVQSNHDAQTEIDDVQSERTNVAVQNECTNVADVQTTEATIDSDETTFVPLPDASLLHIVSSSTGAEGIDFLDEIKRLYIKDPVFKSVIEKPAEFRNFKVENGLLYLVDNGKSLLAIPKGLIGRRTARELVISEAHLVLAHLGARKTITYLRDHVYWKDLVSDVKVFCDTCPTCKQNKPDNQRPYGLLNPLPVPLYPWDSIGVDFVGPFPDSSNRDGTFDNITVIIDHFTSMVHLVPSRIDYNAKQVAELMFECVYKLHGLPRSIVSDRDVLFTSTFWKRLNDLIGPKLKMSSAYHPETDGATERANRTLVQMLRELVNEKQTDWVHKLPAIEFALNSASSETTGFSPFFLNTGRMPRSMIWNSAPSSEFPAVRNFALQRKLALMSAHDSIIAARVKQVRDANSKRRPAPFKVHDLVYLSTKNISFPKGLARKLVPRYIGPYRITEDFGNQSYRLDLSPSLKRRGIHDVFHAALLRIHVANDDRLFPGRLDEQIVPEADTSEQEWAVDRLISHSGSGQESIFEVRWKAGDITWLPYHEISHLPALDAYLEVLGVPDINQLPNGKGSPPLEAVRGPRD